MKKIMILAFALFLTGCGIAQKNKMSVYDQMVQQIHEEKDYLLESDYFDCTLAVTSQSSGGWQYDVIINHPAVDMENVKAIAVCETEKSDIYPSLGLEEGDVCHLFVDKIDKNEHYYEGIRLSGVSQEKKVEVKVYVSFTSHHQMYEQYILLSGEAK